MDGYSYNEILVMTLAGHAEGHWNFFMTRKEAYEQLKRSSGHDFGFDVGKWKEWVEAQRNEPNSATQN
jgi:hypothetical protein